MIDDRNHLRTAEQLSTASMVIAILESRRAYHRALSLARQIFLGGAPDAMTWGEEPIDEMRGAITVAAPTAPAASDHAYPPSVRRLGYPAFQKGGTRTRNRRGLRVLSRG